jgi:hypothetical protein
MVEAKNGSLKRLPRAEYNMADTRWRELGRAPFIAR